MGYSEFGRWICDALPCVGPVESELDSLIKSGSGSAKQTPRMVVITESELGSQLVSLVSGGCLKK